MTHIQARFRRYDPRTGLLEESSQRFGEYATERPQTENSRSQTTPSQRARTEYGLRQKSVKVNYGR